MSVRAAWRGGGGWSRARTRACRAVRPRVCPCLSHPPTALPPARAAPRRYGTGEAGAGESRPPAGSAAARGRAGQSSFPGLLGREGNARTGGGGGGAAGKSEPPREEFSSAPVCLHSPSAQGFVICVFPFPVGRWSRLISLPHPLFRYVFCNCFPVALSPSRRIAHPRKGTRKRRLRSSRHTKGRSHLRPLQEQE